MKTAVPDAEIFLRVWGRDACFTIPHTRTDPVSYPVMTPSAAKGILRALYWKPSFEWVVHAIDVHKPIRYQQQVEHGVTSLSTWGPAEVPSPAARRAARNDPPPNLRDGDNQGGNLTLRRVTSLFDVEYVIHAAIYKNSQHGSRTRESYVEEAKRRMDEGQCWRTPCFGMREFFADWERLEAPPTPLPIDVGVGLMLFDLTPQAGEDNWSPIFFDATIQAGRMRVPVRLWETYLPTLCAFRAEAFPDNTRPPPGRTPARAKAVRGAR